MISLAPGARLNLSHPQPWNWPRACGAWVQEIQVILEPGPQTVQAWEGWLRALRRRFRPAVVGLTLAFTLHCTRPAPAVHRTRPESEAASSHAQGEVFEEQGRSSWYGGNDGFAGRPTASGETFDPAQLTCAHRTLPLGTTIEVENLANGKKVVLRVNDRGPFARGRILDVSQRAARDLGFLGQGTTDIRLRTVDPQGRPAPVDPDLDQQDPYTVQVAALTDPGNIARLSRELEEAFGPVTLQDALTFDGRTVKRLRVGSYTRLAQAQKAAEEIQKRLKDRGVEPFITRRR